jgi:hypothetical protein
MYFKSVTWRTNVYRECYTYADKQWFKIKVSKNLWQWKCLLRPLVKLRLVFQEHNLYAENQEFEV